MIGIAHAYQPNTIFSIPLLYTNIMAKITEAAFWINLLKKMVKSFLKDKGFKKKGNYQPFACCTSQRPMGYKKRRQYSVYIEA